VTPVRRRYLSLGAAVAAVILALVLTAPHPWAGELLCRVQGGEWTNRFRSGNEEIVTAGHECVK
jgi:hypothetical protein